LASLFTGGHGVKMMHTHGDISRLHEITFYNGSFLDEGESDDVEDPGCGTLSVCG
jgi:hypothetical protein